jgi:Tfp pilus assembly protein PilW
VSLFARLRRRLGDESGLTLIELLVAMASGLVVAGGAMGLLTVSEHLGSRATDQVDAYQRGRVALNKIVQQLDSSCVASKVTPVQAGSDATHLIFFSAYGPAVALSPNKNTITFSGGALTESTIPADANTSPPLWAFTGTATTSGILTGVSQAVVSAVTQPIFQYFAYSSGVISSTPLAVPLSTSDAQSVAEVDVSFAAAPSTPGGTQADRSVNQYSRVVLRLSPSSGSATTNAPCS